jgi:hypothetical protein
VIRPLISLAAVALALAGCSTAAEPTRVEVIERYQAVALSCEYADCADGVVKPGEPVSIVLHGQARDDQLSALEDTISQWNAACPSIPLRLGGTHATTMDFFFVDESDMASVLPIHVVGNVGLFNYDWDGSNVITGMTVVIANEIESRELEHFVLEETTQAMGLINDVDDPISIFDGGMGRTTSYSTLDQAVIAYHCQSGVAPGMDASELPE